MMNVPYPLADDRFYLSALLLALVGALLYLAAFSLRLSRVRERRSPVECAELLLLASLLLTLCCGLCVRWEPQKPLDAALALVSSAAFIGALLCASGSLKLIRFADAAACLGLAPLVSGTQGQTLTLLSLCFLCIRAAQTLAGERRYLRRNISHISVKEAFDSLPQGVMFSDEGDGTALINASMRELLARLGADAQHGPRGAWDALLSLPCGEGGLSRSALEDSMIIREPSGVATMLSLSGIEVREQARFELRAVDVSEQYELSAALARDNAETDRLNALLAEQVDKVSETERERQLLLTKAHFHDLLGQRLSIVHQIIESGVADSARLAEIKRMLRTLSADLECPAQQDATQELARLTDSFLLVGTEIEVSGELPDSGAAARTIVYVIREAATNAVRHGRADRVSVRLFCTDGAYCCEITNNGEPPNEPIAEGDGLRGMRYRLSQVGGRLSVSVEPRLLIAAEIPNAGK